MQLPLMITSRDKALKALQDVQLEGLKEIDRICRKHDIHYSLGGGTCLGQVRHGGFIPWDDDIDIDMTLENFNRFVEVAPSELDSSRFCLYTRDTDPTIYRSFARLGILDTALSLTNWEKAGRRYNVFIDILSCSYLPDDEKKRKRVSTRLFILRCLQHYKELGEYANKLTSWQKFLVMILNAIVPVSLLNKYEQRLLNCTKGRTGWLLDDSIIHGAYGGYKSEGVDEYKDVEFEGLTVMSKKETHDFLVTLYGEHYGDWLPPTKRISHHTWTVFNLGHYAEKYELNDSYKDFMSVNYSPAKLKQMKIVSDSMVKEICAICDKHGIKYALPVFSESEDVASLNLDDYWVQPDIIMMLREDYDRFAEIGKNGLSDRLTYQSHVTNLDYYYDYARVHLKFTQIRDKHMRLASEKKVNSGFFVKIIPLDNYSKDKASDNDIKQLNYWRRLLFLKWRTPDAVYFNKLSFKNKVKLILSCRYSLEDIYRKIAHYAMAKNDTDCSFCFDSSRQLGGTTFAKKDIMHKCEIEVNRTSAATTTEELLASVSKHYGPCYLTYYDEPDRQLSILRYDEKSDRLLTNEELLASSLNN